MNSGGKQQSTMKRLGAILTRTHRRRRCLHRLTPAVLAIGLIASSSSSLSAQTADLPSLGTVPALIDQLGSDQFHLRQAAMHRLQQIGDRDMLALSRAAVASPDLEIAERCWSIVRKFVENTDSETLGQLRNQVRDAVDDDDQHAAQIQRLLRPPESPPEKLADAQANPWLNPAFVLPRVPPPAPKPLTPAEKAKLAKRASFNKIIERIDQQTKRMKQTADAAPATERDRFEKAIEKLKQQRTRIEKLRDNIK